MESTLRFASREEKALDEPLDRYLSWLAVEEARYESAGARQKATGCQFLSGLYRKRFGSSVAALRATLRRRLGQPAAPEDHDDDVPLVDTDASDPEDEVLDPGAEAETPPPPLASQEANLATELLEAAKRVPAGRDAKLQALIWLLRERIGDQKVVVFTEYRDTLRAARRRLDSEGFSYVTFHGGTPDPEREQAIQRFLHDDAVRVFLATDAASEGINLQHAASHLVHLDVPWNPNRYAQRNGRIDRYGQQEMPHIWALVAADASRKQGRPEARALEIVIEKLQTISQELGSVGAILPGYSTGSVRRLLQQATADADQQMGVLLDLPENRKVAQDLTRLSFRNRQEIDEAERDVARLGTIDDFEAHLGDLLRTAFRGWDDGGAIERVEPGIVRVQVPGRLRLEVGASSIERATFRRDVAVLAADKEASKAPEFLSPAHPLVEATLQQLRDEATDPRFPHRFDVETGDQEGLVLSFVTRFVDGEGRTVEESLMAIEVGLDGSVSHDPAADFERLGVDAPTSGGVPPVEAIPPWRQAFPRLVDTAQAEAQRRAEQRRAELVDLAHELLGDELEALGLWKAEETKRVEVMTLGPGVAVSFEAGQAYEQGLQQLQAEYGRRREAIRDRSAIHLAGIDLLGGRLIVRAAA